MSDRCHRCDRAVATQADYDACGDDCECQRCISLCWQSWTGDTRIALEGICGAPAVDWRARALAAEAEVARRRAADPPPINPTADALAEQALARHSVRAEGRPLAADLTDADREALRTAVFELKERRGYFQATMKRFTAATDPEVVACWQRSVDGCDAAIKILQRLAKT